MTRRIHTLTVPSSTRYLEDVREFVAHHASEAEFAADIVEQLKMAVDEACTNVIEHAYRGEPERPIDISVIVQSDRLMIRIQDEGRAFDPGDYQEPDLLQFARTRKAGGFGVHIMRRLMDKVEFRTRGAKNECCLVKYRPPDAGA